MRPHGPSRYKDRSGTQKKGTEFSERDGNPIQGRVPFDLCYCREFETRNFGFSYLDPWDFYILIHGIS